MKISVKKAFALIICAALVFICVGQLFSLGLFSGEAVIDPSTDRTEGTIYSSDGATLCQCEGDHHRGTIADPQIYGSLLGHNSDGFGRSDLRKTLESTLYATDKRKAAAGNDVVLTLNDSVERYVYDTMYALSRRGADNDAAAVVLDNTTGEILALVSVKRPILDESGNELTLDYNHPGRFTSVVSQQKITLPNAYYIPEWKLSTQPGSVFKTIAAIPIIEAGLDHAKYTDEGVIKVEPGITVRNQKAAANRLITLREALMKSSNVYFTYIYAYQLTSKDLQNVYDRALLGQPLALDFATLNSSTKLSDRYSYLLSSFGQVTSVSIIHTAALLSGVCSGIGTVMKPYLIDKVVDPNGKVLSVTKPQELTALTDKKTAATLSGYLQATAEGYGFADCMMKTGTAELADGTTQNYCFCSNKQYTVLVSVHNHQGGSQLLKQASHDILNYTASSLLSRAERQEAYAQPSEKAGFFDKLAEGIKGLFAGKEKADKTAAKADDDSWFNKVKTFFSSDNKADNKAAKTAAVTTNQSGAQKAPGGRLNPVQALIQFLKA